MTTKRWARRRLLVTTVDGVQYAVAVNALAVAVLGPPSLFVTHSLVGLKWLLFLAGPALFGVGAVKLRRASPWRADQPRSVGNPDADHGFGGRIGRLPPVAWLDPGPDERLSDGGRLLLAGGVAWLLSFALETVFGVGVQAIG